MQTFQECLHYNFFALISSFSRNQLFGKESYFWESLFRTNWYSKRVSLWKSFMQTFNSWKFISKFKCNITVRWKKFGKAGISSRSLFVYTKTQPQSFSNIATFQEQTTTSNFSWAVVFEILPQHQAGRHLLYVWLALQRDPITNYIFAKKPAFSKNYPWPLAKTSGNIG